MHNPHKPHLTLIKHILRYVKGILSSGFHIGVGSISSLTAYSDANWARCPDFGDPCPTTGSTLSTT